MIVVPVFQFCSSCISFSHRKEKIDVVLNIVKFDSRKGSTDKEQSQSVFTCSKSTMETPEQYLKPVQS